jgi:oxalate decarboxylase
MKDQITSISTAITLALSLSTSAYALTTSTSTEKADTDYNTDPKIQKLLQAEEQQIAQAFPYRMNLFTEGQITKSKAGNRYAETARQFATDNSGLLFFYDLVPTGMRVPHWHANAKEIGTVVEGKLRVTIWEGSGKPKVFTVEKNGTWIIPKSTLHALENVSGNKMEFVVAYDSPIAADKDFLTAWTSLPDAVLARAVGLKEEDIAGIRKTTIDRLSKFDPAAAVEKTEEFNNLSNSFTTTKPLYQGDMGSIVRIDSKLNAGMEQMAIQKTIMKPTALRIPHWYTSGDVLLFVYKGKAFFTMMDDEGKVFHSVIKPGDVVSVPIGNFHSFINIGKDDLEIYEAFNRADEIREISLLNGAQNLNIGMMEGATGLDQDRIKRIKDAQVGPYMVKF